MQNSTERQELGSERRLELDEFLVPLVVLELGLRRGLRLVRWLLVLIDEADQKDRQQEEL